MSTNTNKNDQENVSPGGGTETWETPVLGASPELKKNPGAPVVRDRHRSRVGEGVVGERARRKLDFN